MTAWSGKELRDTIKGWVSKDYPDMQFKSFKDALIYIEKDIKNSEYYDPTSPYTYWFVNVYSLSGAHESLVLNGGFEKLEL